MRCFRQQDNNLGNHHVAAARMAFVALLALIVIMPSLAWSSSSDVIRIDQKKRNGIHARNMMIEIGDSTDTGRKNWINFGLWEGECKFAIDLGSAGINLGGATRGLSQWNGEDRVSISKGGFDFQMYKDDGGNFEWEVHIAGRPPTNSYTFDIKHSGLSFYWQDTLTDAEVAEGSYRPDSVIYSYAVYHSSEGGLNYGKTVDGKVVRYEYQSGKAFHLYRPKVVDDTGWTRWCDLNIDTAANKLTLTMPPGFLDSAQYPIRLDPTFGKTDVGGTNSNSGGKQRAFWVTTGGSSSGNTLDTVKMWVQAVNGGANVHIIFGLYNWWEFFGDTLIQSCLAGSGSKTGSFWTGGTDSLINGTDEVVWFGSKDILENSAGSPYGLANNTDYYLVILTDVASNILVLKYDVGGNNYNYREGTTSRDNNNFDTLLVSCTGVCNSTVSPSPDNRIYSIYAVHGPYPATASVRRRKLLIGDNNEATDCLVAGMDTRFYQRERFVPATH